MDENHQDKTEDKAPATEGKSSLSPISSQDQQGPARPQNNQMEGIIEHLRDRGYKVTAEYNDTGLSKVSGEHPPRKTLWDWGQLLIVPFLIALLGIMFTGAQFVASFKIANDNRAQDLQIAKDNRAQDLRIARDTQEEATLKAYLDDMTTLLLDKKLGSQAVADKATSAEAAPIARTKTLTALRRLTDPQRKATVVRFLYESHLIGYYDIFTAKYGQSLIDLSGADLFGADLSGAFLRDANLSVAHLSRAHLDSADLFGVDLFGADLSAAHLSAAHLGCITLRGGKPLRDIELCADLSNADLSNADLFGAHLSAAFLRDANLSAAHLFGANLSAAILDSAILSGADLSNADLSGAILSGADLSGAILIRADLRGALVTNEQLAQAKSLQGATMPDGSKHP